jgi:hypothetical protein
VAPTVDARPTVAATADTVTGLAEKVGTAASTADALAPTLATDFATGLVGGAIDSAEAGAPTIAESGPASAASIDAPNSVTNGTMETAEHAVDAHPLSVEAATDLGTGLVGGTIETAEVAADSPAGTPATAAEADRHGDAGPSKESDTAGDPLAGESNGQAADAGQDRPSGGDHQGDLATQTVEAGALDDVGQRILDGLG